MFRKWTFVVINRATSLLRNDRGDLSCITGLGRGFGGCGSSTNLLVHLIPLFIPMRRKTDLERKWLVNL